MKVFPTSSEEMLAWIVKVLCYSLKTIGLAPFSIQFRTLTRNSRNTPVKVFLFSRMGLLYNLVLAVLIPIIGFLGISYVLFLGYLDGSPINKTLNIALYVLPLIASTFIVVYLALRQRKGAIIMNRLLDVYFLLSCPKEQSFNKTTYIFILGQMAFHIFSWAFCISLGVAYNLSVLQVDYSVHVLIYFLFLEYSYILRVVARELEILNQNLLGLKAFSSNLFLTSLPREHLAILSLPIHNQLATLKLLHGIRTALFEVAQEIADFFSFPMLICIACTFLSLIEGTYFPIVVLFIWADDVPFYFYINVVTWNSLAILPLILLASNVTETLKKAHLTGKIVYELLASAKNQEIIVELEQFSLQLLHEDLSFTACGFFKLDFTLLQSILGATVTYLVIVLQFADLAKGKH